MSVRYTVADVKRSYTPDKAREEWFGDWASALLYRPLSFLVTPAFLAISCSAGTVTLLSLILGLSLPVIAVYAGDSAFVGIAGLSIIWAVLDCVDGNIARVTATTSRIGQYLDFVADVLFRGSLFMAVGLLPQSMREFGATGFALCMLTGYVAMAARFCRLFYEHYSGEDIFKYNSTTGRIHPNTLVEILFSFLSGIDRLLPFLILVGAHLERMGLVIAYLLIYSSLDFAYTQYVIIRNLLCAQR